MNKKQSELPNTWRVKGKLSWKIWKSSHKRAANTAFAYVHVQIRVWRGNTYISLIIVLHGSHVCFVFAGEAECAWRASVHTRVAAEGQLPRCRVRLCDTEIPVLVNTHCGSIGVPAGVGEQQVLKARQHLQAAKSRRFFLFQTDNLWHTTLSLVKTYNSDSSYNK